MTDTLTREQIEALKTKSKPRYSHEEYRSIHFEKLDALCDLALIGLDAEAMAQAAMAEAFEKAKDACWKVFHRIEKLPGLSPLRVATECKTAIAAITPSSGPWQRVPEGYHVTRIVEVERPTVDLSYAMLAEVNK